MPSNLCIFFTHTKIIWRSTIKIRYDKNWKKCIDSRFENCLDIVSVWVHCFHLNQFREFWVLVQITSIWTRCSTASFYTGYLISLGHTRIYFIFVHSSPLRWGKTCFCTNPVSGPGYIWISITDPDYKI